MIDAFFLGAIVGGIFMVVVITLCGAWHRCDHSRCGSRETRSHHW